MHFKSEFGAGAYLFYEYGIPLGLGVGGVGFLCFLLSFVGLNLGTAVLATMFGGPFLGLVIFKNRFTLVGETPLELTVNNGVISVPDSDKTWRVMFCETERAWSLPPWQVVIVRLRAGEEIARLVYYDRADLVDEVERVLR